MDDLPASGLFIGPTAEETIQRLISIEIVSFCTQNMGQASVGHPHTLGMVFWPKQSCPPAASLIGGVTLQPHSAHLGPFAGHANLSRCG